MTAKQQILNKNFNPGISPTSQMAGPDRPPVNVNVTKDWGTAITRQGHQRVLLTWNHTPGCWKLPPAMHIQKLVPCLTASWLPHRVQIKVSSSWYPNMPYSLFVMLLLQSRNRPTLVVHSAYVTKFSRAIFGLVLSSCRDNYNCNYSTIQHGLGFRFSVSGQAKHGAFNSAQLLNMPTSLYIFW